MSDSKPEGHKRWEFVISLVALMGSAASFLWSNHQDQKLEAEVFDRVDKALQKWDNERKNEFRQKLGDAQILELGHVIEVPKAAFFRSKKASVASAFQISNLGSDTIQELLITWHGIDVHPTTPVAQALPSKTERK